MGHSREPIWVLLFVGSLLVDIGALAGRVPSEAAPPRDGLFERTRADRMPPVTTGSMSSSSSSSAAIASACVNGCAFAARARERDSFDWNSASPRELRRLPGVGEVRALAIARERWARRAEFEWTSLEQLPGIGPQTARRIRAAISSDPPMLSSPSSASTPLSTFRGPRSGAESASTPTLGPTSNSPAPTTEVTDDRRP